jgi:hypothetical protein
MKESGQLQAATMLKAEGKKDRQWTYERNKAVVRINTVPVQKQ